MYTGRSCWLCGRNGTAEPLDKHHIFGGAYRKKSEKYGLTVYLCHGSCHIFGEKAAHCCRETIDRLKGIARTEIIHTDRERTSTFIAWRNDEFTVVFKTYINGRRL